MPLYDAACECGWRGEFFAKVADRDTERFCPQCFRPLTRLPAAPYGKMAGQMVKGGGPDRFTADALGIPLKELPESLKAYPKKTPPA